MDPKLLIFLLGAAGALAPEIIRLWTIAKAGKRMTWSWSYIVVSILFAGLGGLVAFILPAENMNAAFYSGVATPVLANTAIKKAGGESPEQGVKYVVFAMLRAPCAVLQPPWTGRR